MAMDARKPTRSARSHDGSPTIQLRPLTLGIALMSGAYIWFLVPSTPRGAALPVVVVAAGLLVALSGWRHAQPAPACEEGNAA